MSPRTAEIKNKPETGTRTHNFSAGPAVLPEAVLNEIKDELPVYDDIGASVLEISHRSKTYTRIMESAIDRLRSLLSVGDEWHVLFLQGGASMQFYQVPLNFLPNNTSADYLITGSWAKKAFQEAGYVGNARVVASSKETNFDRIPNVSTWELDDSAVYLHYTSNNTIFGTQFRSEPGTTVPLVCDASSDFLSRPVRMDRYGLIYAGAQKNVGPAGVTIVIIHKDFLGRKTRDLPTMLDYGTHVETLFNTPPVFAVYAVEKVLRWLENMGGLEGMQEINERKAGRLYDTIDGTGFYRGTAQKGSRSLMNVCFRLPSEALEARFLSDSDSEGLTELKGHRSVGGIRASIYNACPENAVDALIEFMNEFERRNG